MIRGRLRRRGERRAEGEPEPQYIEIDPRELTGIFSVPQWLRDVGLMSWLLVGRRDLPRRAPSGWPR